MEKFYLVLLFIFPISLYGQELLYQEYTPVNVSPNDNRWDFSGASRTGDYRAFSRMYGDTIYAETIADFRSSYRVSGDTLKFLMDESRTLAMTKDYNIRGYSYKSCNGSEDSLHLTGITPYYSVTHNGIMRNTVVGQGLLSYDGESDLHKVYVWCEEREFEQKVVGYDHIASNVRTRRYRWMKNGYRLPLAIQYEIATALDDGKYCQVYEALYLPDADDLTIESSNGEMPSFDWQPILNNTNISWENGLIIVINPHAFGGETLTVDIADIPGNLYGHTEVSITGPLELSISTSGMPSGNYMVTVRVYDNIAAYKQMIHIP